MNITIYPHNGGYLEVTEEGVNNRTGESFHIVNSDLKIAHIVAPKTKLKWKDF